MSGLYLWAPRLLFMWQLLWLLVHAAPAQFPKLSLDPVLTSISPEENGPSPNPQEIPAQEPEVPEVGEPYSIDEEASTQSAVSPKLLKSLFVNGVQEELPATPENSDSSIEQKNSALLQFPLASVEPPPFQQKGPAQHPKNSMYLKMTVSPLGSGRVRYPMLPYMITPQPPKNIKLLATAKEVTAYFAKFPEAVEPQSQEEIPPKLSETRKSSSSWPTSGADATALQLTIGPSEHPQETLQHQEPVKAQQLPWSDITGWPLNLELTIKPEAAVEGEHQTALKLSNPRLTLPHPEPVQAQQPPWSEITGQPLDLGLTIKPEAAGEGEHPTTLKLTTPPPEHLHLTLPHPQPVQAQQPPWSEITGQPLDLGLTIKPEAAGEGEHPTALKLTTTPPEHPAVTLPHPQPVQAQQPPWSEITGRPLDLGLTIKPEAAGEGEHPTALKLTIPPPEHPAVTLPHPQPVQAQQPPWSEITGRPLDLGLTIKPEAAGEGEHPTALKLTIPPPEHPAVTLPHPQPVQAQQPPWSEITGRPLDLELTIKPEAAGEGEHPTALKLTTTPPEHPAVTLPHPQPVQAQQPPWSEITGRPLDLGLTIKPEAAGEGEHPTALKLTIPPPEHPAVTLPHPQPVQAQQPPWSEITGRPLDLGLTIKPEAAGEGEHPTALKLTIPPPEHPAVTLPHPQPVQAQQPPWSEITGQPFTVVLTIKPEVAVEGEYPTALQQTTAPPEHPQVTLLHPETIATQYSAWTDMINPNVDEQFIRMQHPMSPETGPPTAEQKAVMNVCELCTCNNETLSCTGFGPKQKLHRVPVPQPNTHNGTFTTLNLKGNSISQFDKNIWKSYHETEKLILSDNNLKELHKESFEGLLFLKYLDLSGNNIKFIEESAFETLPFLEYLNLGGNLITEVNSGMFQAWHGMQFLHTLILHHNPLTTIEDPYLFKLPALQYLDLGTTQVSLTTVKNILTMSTKLEKLILPHHLACCLCQVKNTIETVSHTVRLHCDTECLTKTHCEEEPHLTSEEGSLLKVLQDRKNTSAELMIEPERTSSDKNDDNLSAFLNLLMKLLSEQEEAKVSKVEWDVNQWENEKTEAPDEEEEEEALGRSNEVPMLGYVYRNKVLVATPVIAVAAGFTLIICLILICGRVAPKEDKEGKPRGFISSVLSKSSQDSKMKVNLRRESAGAGQSRAQAEFTAPRLFSRRAVSGAG
ncbi:hypothetical protein HJG60_011866 [Phyllostomus discolor]|uniref:Uncharacterized protein n=1 Tax=Phyllostomus discolor TaxID=89673 RepID=A0A833ZLI3_9CHIR|nr:hypothetical protein HJG60_011866 [Phyllostomus discolor]